MGGFAEGSRTLRRSDFFAISRIDKVNTKECYSTQIKLLNQVKCIFTVLRVGSLCRSTRL